MGVHFIEESNLMVAFFPETLRFFKINEITKTIIKDILEGADEEDILERRRISAETLAKVKKLMNLNSKERIKTISNKDDKYLNKLVLNVTNKCNLGCKYCYANGGNYCSEEGVMSKELALDTLNKFYDKYDGVRFIQLFGGEPTLNLEVIEAICEYIEEGCISGRIKLRPIIGTVTNGTIVNDKFIELINKYNINVTVSIDGPISVNDKMRIFKDGRGTFEKISENIKFMKKVTSQPSGIEATYNINHVNENISVYDVVKFFKKEFNVDSVHIVPATGDDSCDFAIKDRESFISSVDNVFDGIKEGTNITYSFINKVMTSLTKKLTSQYLCEAGISMFSVASNGDIYPCFMLTDVASENIGNIKDKDFFNSERFIEKKNKLLAFSKFKDEKCSTCFNNTICNGCLGLNYLETGDVKLPKEVTCDMQRRITEKVILNIVKNSSVAV